MFSRLKTLLGGWRSTRNQADSLRDWAQQQDMAFVAVTPACYVLSGRLANGGFRAECGPSSRSFIEGLELRAKVELGLQLPGAVVVMNRSLKRQLDAQASALYSDYIDDLKTSALNLPEEIRWLSRYRDLGWSGPPDAFWAAFSVLTDTPELARQWLDASRVQALMATAALRQASDSPFMLMLMRGNTYLRVQVDPGDGRQTHLETLAFFGLASQAAKGLRPG